MKRAFCLVFIFLLAIYSYTAFAQTDEVILFRNIEWGSSVPAARAKLAEDPAGIKWGSTFKMRSCSTPYFIENASYNLNLISEYDNITSLFITSRQGDFEVAGHKVKHAYLIFALLPDKNNDIEIDSYHEREETSFYRAMYYFKDKVKNGLLEDLEQKLTSLYGEPDSKTTEPLVGSLEKDVIVWKGANNTYCAIHAETRGKEDITLFLIYGTYDGDKLIEQANEIMAMKKQKEEEEKKNNTDGL